MLRICWELLLTDWAHWKILLCTFRSWTGWLICWQVLLLTHRFFSSIIYFHWSERLFYFRTVHISSKPLIFQDLPTVPSFLLICQAYYWLSFSCCSSATFWGGCFTIVILCNSCSCRTCSFACLCGHRETCLFGSWHCVRPLFWQRGCSFGWKSWINFILFWKILEVTFISSFISVFA